MGQGEGGGRGTCLRDCEVSVWRLLMLCACTLSFVGGCGSLTPNCNIKIKSQCGQASASDTGQC